MRRYRVISPFRLKDESGNPKGYAELGHIVHLSDLEAGRLCKANCIEEVKTYLRMESTDSTAEDGLLGNYIVVARKQAEHLTRRALIVKTWQLRLDDFANDTAIIEL